MGPEGTENAATTQPAATDEGSILKDAGAEGKSLLDSAQTEQQQEQVAEEKRLLDADPNTLSDEDKNKRTVIEKTRADKKLLDTPDDQLNDEQKAKKAELAKAQEEAKKEVKAPEKYEDFKMPEGFTIDKVLMEKATPLFKELDLTQDKAQKLVDFDIERQKSATTAQAEAFKKYLTDSKKETIAALGADYKEKLAYVAKVRDRFLSKETQELLEASGLSNVNSLVQDLIKIGQSISEDKMEEGKHGEPGKGDAASKLYPDQGK